MAIFRSRLEAIKILPNESGPPQHGRGGVLYCRGKDSAFGERREAFTREGRPGKGDVCSRWAGPGLRRSWTPRGHQPPSVLPPGLTSSLRRGPGEGEHGAGWRSSLPSRVCEASRGPPPPLRPQHLAQPPDGGQGLENMKLLDKECRKGRVAQAT